MHLFGQVELPTWIVLAAVILTVAFLLVRSQRSYSSQGMPQPLGSRRVGRTPDPGHHLEAPGAMVQWEVQMHDTARQLAAQLDSKMGALEQLIREADRAAARLEAALAASRSGTGFPASPPRDEVSDSAETVIPAPSASQAAALRAEGATKPGAEEPGPQEILSGGKPSPGRRHDEIYTLADYGYDPMEIAHRVGMPVGEVQLILSLRSQRQGP